MRTLDCFFLHTILYRTYRNLIPARSSIIRLYILPSCVSVQRSIYNKKLHNACTDALLKPSIPSRTQFLYFTASPTVSHVCARFISCNFEIFIRRYLRNREIKASPIAWMNHTTIPCQNKERVDSPSFQLRIVVCFVR